MSAEICHGLLSATAFPNVSRHGLVVDRATICGTSAEDAVLLASARHPWGRGPLSPLVVLVLARSSCAATVHSRIG